MKLHGWASGGLIVCLPWKVKGATDEVLLIVMWPSSNEGLLGMYRNLDCSHVFDGVNGPKRD